MDAKKREALARLRSTSVRNEPLYPGSTEARRGVGWSKTDRYPNDNIAELGVLIARSRRAMNADPYARGIVLALVADIVGWGIDPVSLAKNPEDKKLIEAAWFRWVKTADTWGMQQDFAGLQWQIAWSWLVSGEVFVRLRRRRLGDATPLQLEILEPEFVPRNWDSPLPNTPAGNRVRAGIEFDRIGNVMAYYMYRNRPGAAQDLDPTELVRVPARIEDSLNVLHVYRPERPGQLRGTPHLAPALMRLRDLEVFTDAVLVRQGLSNLLTATWSRAASDTVSPITGEAPSESAADGRPLVRIGVGALNEIGPGEELKYNNPPDPPTAYHEFVKGVLRAAGAATGVPYEIQTSDWTGSNDRLARVQLQGYRRKVQASQFTVMVNMLCQPVFAEWLRASVDAGVLPFSDFYTTPEKYTDASWAAQAWPYINPTQDVEAQTAAIRAGLTSRAAIVSETGERAEVIDAQQAADNARADSLSLVYDSDGRTQKAPPAAASGNGRNGDDGDGPPPAAEDDDPENPGGEETE